MQLGPKIDCPEKVLDSPFESLTLSFIPRLFRVFGVFRGQEYRTFYHGIHRIHGKNEPCDSTSQLKRPLNSALSSSSHQVNQRALNSAALRKSRTYPRLFASSSPRSVGFSQRCRLANMAALPLDVSETASHFPILLHLVKTTTVSTNRSPTQTSTSWRKWRGLRPSPL